MDQERNRKPTNSDSGQEKERVVAWLWLRDRVETDEPDYYERREVWKTLELGTSGPETSNPLDSVVPILESEARRLLNEPNFEASLYRKFGITDLNPRPGYPKGPYFDPSRVSRLELANALDEPVKKTIKQRASDKTIHSINELIVERVKKDLGRDPDILSKLSPQEFSRLVSELLQDMGADIYTIQGGADSGIDIFAHITHPALQKMLVVVECKQHKKRDIEANQVKQFLFTAREQYRATNAMFVTTTHFTPEARYWEEQYRWFLSLRDYDALCEWLGQYGQWEKSSSWGIWIPKRNNNIKEPLQENKSSYNHVKFHHRLCECFNLSELRIICFSLQIDYENIRGNTKEEYAMELLRYCSRRGKTDLLVEECRKERPHINWLDLA